MIQYKNSKKQGDAGLGQAIAYFTKNEYDVAIPLTDSCDWDLVVEKNGVLQRVQIKTSYQRSKWGNNPEKFSLATLGGNRSWNGKRKVPADQNYDLLFLYHLETKIQVLIPKEIINHLRSSIDICEKYQQYIVL